MNKRPIVQPAQVLQKHPEIENCWVGRGCTAHIQHDGSILLTKVEAR